MFKNYYKYLNAFQKKSEYSSEYPPYVGLEVTAICNLKCNKCPYGREKVVLPQHSYMDMKLYRKIIDEIKGKVIGVTLSGFGEPFVNPNFFEYVDYAKRNYLKVSFYSNGTILDDDIIDNIVKYKVDSIGFSIDCLPDQYAFYSHMKNIPLDIAKGHLIAIIRNIEKLLIRIKKSGCHIDIAVIRLDAPESTPLEEYTSFWKKRGVNVSEVGVLDWGGTVNRVKLTKKRGMEIKCPSPYDLSVFSSGMVPLCCVDYNATVPLGDANIQTIKEIYNGKPIRDVRKRIFARDYKGLPCALCRYDGFGINIENTFVHLLSQIPNIYNSYPLKRIINLLGVIKHKVFLKS